MSGEIFGAEKSFFFGGDQDKKDGALDFFGMGFEAGGDVHNESAAGAIVQSAVVNTIAVDGCADANVIDVRGEDDVFIFERWIGAGKFGDDVGGFERFGLDDGVGF